MIGVSPNGEIEDISELIPAQEVLDDIENIDKLTEEISLQSFRLNEPLFEYLRSTMTSHYVEMGGVDSEFLMLSCPRVVDFELLCVEWAIKLLQKTALQELLKRRSID